LVLLTEAYRIYGLESFGAMHSAYDTTVSFIRINFVCIGGARREKTWREKYPTCTTHLPFGYIVLRSTILRRRRRRRSSSSATQGKGHVGPQTLRSWTRDRIQFQDCPGVTPKVDVIIFCFRGYDYSFPFLNAHFQFGILRGKGRTTRHASLSTTVCPVSQPARLLGLPHSLVPFHAELQAEAAYG
jgi:hypothetical protein